MGGNSSSRRASFEPEDEEGVTLVKGIRLTDRVIDRMREPPAASRHHSQSKSQAHPSLTQSTAPLGETQPLGETLRPILPQTPPYASSLVPPPLREYGNPLVTPKTLEEPSPGAASAPTVEAVPHLAPRESLAASAPEAQENVTFPSTTSASTESVEDVNVSPPPTNETVTPCLPTEHMSTPFEDTSTSPKPPSPDAPPPVITPPAAELVNVPPSPSVTITPQQVTSDILAPPTEPTDLPATSPPSSVVAVPSEMPSTGPTGSPQTDEIPAHPPSSPTPTVQTPFTETACLFATTPQQWSPVNEEELRKQIRTELQEMLQEEMKIAQLKILQQLEEEKAKAKAEAQAKAQLQIQAEVQKVLEREEAALQQSLKDAIIKERMKTEDERLLAQYYWMERKIQKLEEKEKDLIKQDTLYWEQITKLNEKTAQFTRVTAESFRKGLVDTQKRFKTYQIKPVCSELQSEILKCYRENAGQTLTCSNIASLYLQCVDGAKQSKKLSTGG